MNCVRRGIGVLLVLIGAAVSGAIYAGTAGTNRGMGDPVPFIIAGIAAIIAFGAFALARRLRRSRSRQLMLGMKLFYVTFVAIAVATSWSDPKAWMWLGVMIFIGVTYFLPMLALVWWGSRLILKGWRDSEE